ncbi:hypothetical protein D3C77_229720 [compost metagenome]
MQLPPLPDHDGHAAEQQGGEQQSQVLPEARRFAQAWVLGLQPTLMELLQVLGRDGLQAPLDNVRQLRPVTPRSNTQQLGQADIANHCQVAEFTLAGQPAQLCFIHHGIAGLLAEHQLQRLALLRNALQVEVRVGCAQIVGHRTGHAHRHPFVAGEFLQVYRHRTGTGPDDQLRHAHVGVTEQPQTQPRGRLGQTWGQVDLTRDQRPLQRGLVREVTPGQVQSQ